MKFKVELDLSNKELELIYNNKEDILKDFAVAALTQQLKDSGWTINIWSIEKL